MDWSKPVKLVGALVSLTVSCKEVSSCNGLTLKPFWTMGTHPYVYVLSSRFRTFKVQNVNLDFNFDFNKVNIQVHNLITVRLYIY